MRNFDNGYTFLADIAYDKASFCVVYIYKPFEIWVKKIRYRYIVLKKTWILTNSNFLFPVYLFYFIFINNFLEITLKIAFYTFINCSWLISHNFQQFLTIRTNMKQRSFRFYYWNVKFELEHHFDTLNFVFFVFIWFKF